MSIVFRGIIVEIGGAFQYNNRKLVIIQNKLDMRTYYA